MLRRSAYSWVISERARFKTVAGAEEPGSGDAAVGGSDIVTRAWETAGSGAAGTSSAAPSTGTSGASRAVGADSTRRCSSCPHEDDRAGEMRALLPPFSAGGTAAASSFLFFAEDVGLINQRRALGNNKYQQG